MPLISNQPNLLFEDIEYDEDLRYLLASKSNSEFHGQAFYERIHRYYKSIDRLKSLIPKRRHFVGRETHRLQPQPLLLKRRDIVSLASQRRSIRKFSPGPIELDELGNVLCYSFSQIKSGHRITPSAGGLDALEIYVLAFNVQGLPVGVYHFESQIEDGAPVHRLIKLSHSSRSEMLAAYQQSQWFQNPAASLVVTAQPERLRVKYGRRSLRFLLLEAGTLGMQMNLIATSMRLGFCFDGGGYEDRIENLIDIDGYRELILTQFMIGKRDRRK